MSSGAALQRVYRRRQAAGELVVPVVVDAEDLEMLVEARTLDPRADFHSREAIAAAIKAYLKISREA